LDNGTATAGSTLEAIADNADAAHMMGYDHAPRAMGMRHYNENQEHFVFSNGAYHPSPTSSHNGTTSHTPLFVAQ
jgi:hypothetical protein